MTIYRTSRWGSQDKDQGRIWEKCNKILSGVHYLNIFKKIVNNSIKQKVLEIKSKNSIREKLKEIMTVENLKQNKERQGGSGERKTEEGRRTGYGRGEWTTEEESRE